MSKKVLTYQQARVLVNHFVEDEEVQTWTDWFSWGIWSPHIARKSISRTDTLAKLDVDTLTIRGSKGETASKVQVKVILKTDDPSVTTVVRYLHGTLKNTINPILKEYEEEIDLTNLDINIETPALSQMIRDPRSRNSICSPTTVTMLLHRYGETHLLPDELAQNTYDNSYGFGNWSFAMAIAGSYGYKAYIDFLNMEDLKREIYNGYPVGVSVRYRHIEDSTSPYPYVEGAPGTTAGHLIVVTGFTVIDGVEYVLVNDPFAPDNETTPRIYKLDQFDEAWSNRAAYIVREKEANAGKYPTMRLKAELVKTEIPNEYEVYYKGENINIYNFGGRLAYTIDNNKTHGYFPKAAKNSLTISEEDIYNPNLKVYIITDLGKVYVARYYNGPK